MCAPLPIVLTAASTLVSVAGQGYAALSANAQSRYAAKVATQNARLETDRARDAIERGGVETRRYQRQLSQEMGQQNAALAANGIDIGFGSALDVRTDLADAGRQDSTAIMKNALGEARGFEISAANYLAERSAQRRQGRAALVSGLFNMGSTVLGGATQISRIRDARRRGAAW